jgi:hypothetical protein
LLHAVHLEAIQRDDLVTVVHCVPTHQVIIERNTRSIERTVEASHYGFFVISLLDYYLYMWVFACQIFEVLGEECASVGRRRPVVAKLEY